MARTSARVLAVMAALIPFAGQASAGVIGDGPYILEMVATVDGGEMAARTSVRYSAGVPMYSKVEQTRKYRKSVSFDGAVRVLKSEEGRLRTGSEIRVDVADDAEAPRFNILLDLSQMTAMKEFTQNGETIDLPSVRSWSVKDSVVPERNGTGWRYESGKDENGLSLTVSLRPVAP